MRLFDEVLAQEALRKDCWTAFGTSTATNQAAGYSANIILELVQTPVELLTLLGCERNARWVLAQAVPELPEQLKLLLRRKCVEIHGWKSHDSILRLSRERARPG